MSHESGTVLEKAVIDGGGSVTSFAERNPKMLLAAIVILVIIVLLLYFDGRGYSFKPLKAKIGLKGKKEAAAQDSDGEMDELIDEISKKQSKPE